MADATALYGKYVGNWGGECTVWRFDAKKNGKVIASTVRCPGAALHLEITPSHTELHEVHGYDMAAVRIRILDEYGNIAPYAQLPVKLTVEGNAMLVGPDAVTAEGGMCGTYIRTTGKAGSAILTVSAPGLEEKKVVFTIA
jgi:beta-galactosidase